MPRYAAPQSRASSNVSSRTWAIDPNLMVDQRARADRLEREKNRTAKDLRKEKSSAAAERRAIHRECHLFTSSLTRANLYVVSQRHDEGFNPPRAPSSMREGSGAAHSQVKPLADRVTPSTGRDRVLSAVDRVLNAVRPALETPYSPLAKNLKNHVLEKADEAYDTQDLTEAEAESEKLYVEHDDPDTYDLGSRSHERRG